MNSRRGPGALVSRVRTKDLNRSAAADGTQEMGRIAYSRAMCWLMVIPMRCSTLCEAIVEVRLPPMRPSGADASARPDGLLTGLGAIQLH